MKYYTVWHRLFLTSNVTILVALFYIKIDLIIFEDCCSMYYVVMFMYYYALLQSLKQALLLW